MVYIEESQKSVQEVVDTIQEKISDYKFGVLHIHNVKETLKSKGVDFENECQVLDICNPNYAKQLLSTDMTIASIIPCKISVYKDEGQTYVALNSVTQLIDDINPDLLEVAEEIQETVLKLINDVK